MNSKMQPVLILPLSQIFEFSCSPMDHYESSNISGKVIDDSRNKLKMEENLRNEEAVEEKKQVVSEDKEDRSTEKEEEEFSFNCTNSDVSLVSAEDVFVNGKIRPLFPIIADRYDSGSPLRPQLKKPFVKQPEICPLSSVTTELEDLNNSPHGQYSKCTKKLAMDTSPEKCNKSNSTRFLKRGRFLELLHRSNCDGKDASVFLYAPASGGSHIEIEKVNIKTDDLIELKVPKGTKIKTSPSANEKYYLSNKAKKESNKRRSYLPYKLGFFVDVNVMSRKLHAF